MRGGTTARFDGTRLCVARGRTTWTLPVRALDSAELTRDGAVRVGIHGEPGRSDHGLGRAVVLRAPNARAAEAFLARLTAALATVEPVPDGHALVRVETRAPARRLPALGRRGRAALRIALAVPPYALALFVLGLASPRGSDAVPSLIVGGVLGLVGGVPLVRVVRRVCSLWLLRRRGIGVVGRVTGHVHIWDKGGHLWLFSLMDFTTVDGERMRGVTSVVTIWAFSPGADSGQAELVYDPENPTRASRPLTAGFVLRTLLLTAVAAVPTLGFLDSVRYNLPF